MSDFWLGVVIGIIGWLIFCFILTILTALFFKASFDYKYDADEACCHGVPCDDCPMCRH